MARATNEIGNDDLNENRIKTLDVFIHRDGAEDGGFYQHVVPDVVTFNVRYTYYGLYAVEELLQQPTINLK